MEKPTTEENQRQPSKSGGGQGGTPSPSVIGGAALVGAGVGVLLSGPILAVGLAAGAAGLCLRDGQAGDIARSTGQAGKAVIDKGKEVNQRYGLVGKVKESAEVTYEKAKEVDQEHKVVEKVKNAAQVTLERAKRVDEEHKVVERAKIGASNAWERIREADKEHHLTDKASAAFGSAMDSITKAVPPKK